jgi:hypothetical protein
MRTAIRIIVLYMIFPSIWLGAQGSSSDGNQQSMENAAVKYLGADASLRQSYALPS